jgi:glycosyltransferase domain-containing protein
MKDFCLLIVTNRENFLDSLFSYYSKVNFRVIIAHNIKKRIKAASNKNIELIFIDEEKPFERITKVIKKINEKYFMLFSDDDYIFPEKIQKSVDFLKSNRDFSNAHGLQLSIEIKNTKLISNYKNIDYSLVNLHQDSKSIKIRLIQLLTTRYDDKLYSVVRKQLFLEIINCFKEVIRNYPTSAEIILNLCICLSGRTKIFNEISWCKLDHELNGYKTSKEKTFTQLIYEKDFRNKFVNCLLKFCKIKNIEKSNKYFILLLLFFFTFKLYLLGKFKFIRFIFNRVKFVKLTKLKFALSAIYKKADKNLKKIQKLHSVNNC